MKTFLKTNILPILSIVLLTTLSNPRLAFAKKTSAPERFKISAFNRVIVYGNVEVLLISRPTIGICYEDNSGGNVKVTQSGNQLYISGTSTWPAKILLYVNSIYRIEAYDKAIIRNEGKLEIRYLQIIMKNNAQASLNVNTDGIYTSITDNSILKLEGNTNNYTLITNGASKFIANNFICKKINTEETVGNLKNQLTSTFMP